MIEIDSMFINDFPKLLDKNRNKNDYDTVPIQTYNTIIRNIKLNGSFGDRIAQKYVQISGRLKSE